MKLVFLKFRDNLLVLQWLKTNLTAEFITNSNSLGFSPLKNIFLSSAKFLMMVPHGYWEDHLYIVGKWEGLM